MHHRNPHTHRIVSERGFFFLLYANLWFLKTNWLVHVPDALTVKKIIVLHGECFHMLYDSKNTNIQSEHKFFPWLQIFITRKLRGIQTYFFFQNVTQLKKFLETNLSNGKKNVCIPRSFPVINVCSQGKNLCSPCIISL